MEKKKRPSINWSNLVFVMASTYVLISIGLLAKSVLDPYIADPEWMYAKDMDWPFLHRGLARIHSFSDTASWWNGTWCGEVPFWRPLTSYVFWGMNLLWPEQYLLPREIISIIFHVGFLAIAGLFLWRLTQRRWLVLLTLWLFSGLRPDLPIPHFGTNQAVYDVLHSPKNIPDSLAGIAVIASLILLLRGRWVWSLVLATIGVGFKEIGFVTWPLAVLTLVWANRSSIGEGRYAYLIGCLKRNRLPIAGWSVALVLMIAIHFYAVGLGYTYASNHFWYRRALMFWGGPVVTDFLSGRQGAAVIAVLSVVMLVALRRTWLPIRLIGLMGAITVGVFVDAHLLGVQWDVSMTRMFSCRCDLPTIITLVLWGWIAYSGRRDWQTMAIAFSMCLVAAAPTWVALQAKEHTRYLASFFMELAAAAALCQWAAVVSGLLKSIRGSRKRPAHSTT